jgi:hypothetical protein
MYLIPQATRPYYFQPTYGRIQNILAVTVVINIAGFFSSFVYFLYRPFLSG